MPDRLGSVTAIDEHTIIGEPDLVANALRRAYTDGRLLTLVTPPQLLPDGTVTVTVGMPAVECLDDFISSTIPSRCNRTWGYHAIALTVIGFVAWNIPALLATPSLTSILTAAGLIIGFGMVIHGLWLLRGGNRP